MDKVTTETAQAMLIKYKQQNQQLWHALCAIHKYVDASDAQLEEENISRADILDKAREMKHAYEKSVYEGMIIKDVGSL
jgi:hypothetical protein